MVIRGVGLLDENGNLLGSSSSLIQIWKDGAHVEQSSTDIWHAICAAVNKACSLAKVAPKEVKGLGFAATRSLVAVDADGSPVSVSWSGDSRRNVIVWMDHRAIDQAERLNSSDSPVLYCGGALSREMEPPKLLWVKENLSESWVMVFRWMDLSDWLSYRALGELHQAFARLSAVYGGTHMLTKTMIAAISYFIDPQRECYGRRDCYEEIFVLFCD